MVEAADLKSVQCRFESDRGYSFFTNPALLRGNEAVFVGKNDGLHSVAGTEFV